MSRARGAEHGLPVLPRVALSPGPGDLSEEVRLLSTVELTDTKTWLITAFQELDYKSECL